MADTIGAIQVVATINTKDYDAAKKKIEKGNGDLGSDASKTSGKFAGVWVAAGKTVAASLAAVSTATVAMVTSSVKSFADYEQLVGGVDTLFKDSSKAVQKYADEAYKTAGLSANQYMETVTGFSASLLQGLGGDTKKAAEISNKAVTDMADNANKMGTDMARIQDAYQGFAKDNFTMLDNLKLGYGGTATEMARLVNDSGVMGKSFKATAENVANIPFDKLIEAIHVTQTELGITGTTAKEASETISGSFMAMQASWQNLVSGMANPDADFNSLLGQFINSAKTFGSNVLPAMERALDGVVKLVADLVPEIIKELPGTFSRILPTVVSATVGILTALIEVIPTLIPVLINATLQLLNAMLNALPKVLPALIGGVIALLNGAIKIITTPGMISAIIMAALTLFMAILEAMPQIIDALIKALPLVIASVVGFMTDPAVIKQLIKASALLFGALILAVPQILGSLLSALGSLISEVWKRLKDNFTKFGENFGKSIGDAIKGGINGVLGWIENQINGIIGNINGMMKSIDDVVPGDQSGMRIPKLNIPRLAEGGIVQKRPGGILANIGEGREDEAVIPLSKLEAMTGNDNKPQQAPQISVTIQARTIDSRNDIRNIAVETIEAYNEIMVSRGLKPLPT